MTGGLAKDWISPGEVLAQVASAIPEDCRRNVVVIGSLAAGYQLLGGTPSTGFRTKDVDCMLSPRVEAVAAGRAWTERLFARGWTLGVLTAGRPSRSPPAGRSPDPPAATAGPGGSAGAPHSRRVREARGGLKRRFQERFSQIC